MSFSSYFRNFVFGDQVTKILHKSLFTFLLSEARQAKTEHIEMKILQPIFGILVVLTKNELTKICNEVLHLNGLP